MQKHYKAAFLIVLFSASTAVFPDALPQNISSQLPAGFTALTFKSADINNDKLNDYIVVAHRENEKELSESEQAEPSPRRPLLIFTQKTDATFTLAARNDAVVSAVDEGGQCDPFLDSGDGLAVKSPFFTIENGVACGSHWTDYITFKYSPKLHNWVFHKRIFESWVMNNSTKPDADALVLEKRSVSTGDKAKPVLLEKYQPD